MLSKKLINNNLIFCKQIVYSLLTIVIIVVFVVTLLNYKDSKTIYLIFSLIFFIMLGTAFYKPKTYSYLFLSVFLFLGFWLKLSIHTIFDYPYVEPIGNFINCNTNMDDVLIVVISGILGVIMSNIFIRFINIRSTVLIKYENRKNKKDKIYEFFKKYKKMILLLFIVSCLFVSFSNIYYGIQLIGVVPKIRLIYPLNALVYWILAIGFSLIFSYFLELEINFNKQMKFVLFIGFSFLNCILSVSILSRGAFVYAQLAIFSFIFFNYEKFDYITFKKILIYTIITLFLFLIVIKSVTVLRNYYYSEIPFSSSSSSSLVNVISGLIFDRWVGLEGVMAVISYPEKSLDLLISSLTYNPAYGAFDVYQYISKSHYVNSDSTKYVFATLPGAIALLYFSGSKIVVFCGMFIITTLISFLEKIAYIISRTTLFASLIGISFASTIAQLGSGIILWLKSLVILFCFLACLKIFEFICNKFYREG